MAFADEAIEMPDETIESGALLPVLRRASHAELKAVVEGLNKGLDVFITWTRATPKPGMT